MGKNVMIPLSLMNRIIDLLGYWYVSKYDVTIQLEHYDTLRALKCKKYRLGLRDGYAKIIRAKDDDTRDEARINYLQQKCWLRDGENGVPF